MRRVVAMPGVVLALVMLASLISVPAVGLGAVPDAGTRNVRTEESGLADVIVDAIRSLEKADVAIMAASSFDESATASNPLKSTEVLAGLVFRNDKITVMKLTGEQLRRALEHGLALYPARNAAFLQVSGLTVNVDGSAPRGARVVGLKVGKSLVEDAKLYSVAMPAPLANGAVLYSKVWSKSDIDRETDHTLEDAVNAYLSSPRSSPEKTGERLAFK